jgi:predicted adenine nucleotide alpha hydrolase (AANH) superfamily ATPase
MYRQYYCGCEFSKEQRDREIAQAEYQKSQFTR